MLEVYEIPARNQRKIDLEGTDLHVPVGKRTEIEVMKFKKPLKRRLRELFKRA